jgi:hypothetical protein
VPDLAQALTPRALGLEERLGGGVVIAPGDGQAGGGDVEHGDGHGVGDHVVDLPGDPLALVGGGLLGQPHLGRLEGGHRLDEATHHGADGHADDDRAHPDDEGVELVVDEQPTEREREAGAGHRHHDPRRGGRHRLPDEEGGHQEVDLRVAVGRVLQTDRRRRPVDDRQRDEDHQGVGRAGDPSHAVDGRRQHRQREEPAEQPAGLHLGHRGEQGDGEEPDEHRSIGPLGERVLRLELVHSPVAVEHLWSRHRTSLSCALDSASALGLIERYDRGWMSP